MDEQTQNEARRTSQELKKLKAEVAEISHLLSAGKVSEEKGVVHAVCLEIQKKNCILYHSSVGTKLLDLFSVSFCCHGPRSSLPCA